MHSIDLLLILISLFVLSSIALNVPKFTKVKVSKQILKFGPSDKDEGKNDKPSKSTSIFQRVKRLLGFSRREDESLRQTPLPDSSQRYHLRLRNPQFQDRRHITTRLVIVLRILYSASILFQA